MKERKLEYTLLAIGALLVLSRFLFLGHTPFVTDEPAIHLVADEYFASGKFPLTLFRGSQVHIPYGAGALWFYMFFRLFTWNPVFMPYAHTVFFSLAFVLLYFAVRIAYSRLTAAWALVFAASSPFLFELSRHPWDNTFCVPLSAAVLFLVAYMEKLESDPEKNRKRIWACIIGLAVVVAYAVNIHLMAVPLAAAAGFALLYFLWQMPRWTLKEKSWAFAAFCGVFTLLIIPYAYAAWVRWETEPMTDNLVHNTPWGDGRNLWWLFLREELYSSVWRTTYLFDPYLKDFYAYIGPVFEFLFHKDIIGWFAKVAGYVFVFSSAFALIKYRRIRLVPALTVFFFFIYLLQMQYSNIPTDPHHFTPLWWIVFVGAVVMLERLKGFWKRGFQWILVANIAINVSFCVFFLGFLLKNGGINSPAHGLGVKYHVAAVREGCNRMRARGLTEANWDMKDTVFLQHSFHYLLSHVPECEGLTVHRQVQGDPKAPLALVHDRPDTADAKVHWVER